MMSTFPHLPWMDTRIAEHLIRQQDILLFGCLTVLAEFARPDGKISYDEAVQIFTEAPGMNQQKAETSITRLVDAGWVVQMDQTLAIAGYGSSIPPRYARLKPD
ncbi:hypothetical protein E4191_10915 [Paracoccus liaowanqingii]|uniref:Uncharacterized protein n=2 Tax=Paracoccus liaowanqingii TaxID=2560053 RepID=A0A4P7HLN8_9RHOB|nr:hypothetical protein E4191_10915 [Paracoccus liaowanqingii]